MIKVLIVDDHALFRQGLREILQDTPDIEVVAEAGSYGQALVALRAHEVRVVVADIGLPGRDGMELISSLRKHYPEVAVLVLTMQDDAEYIARAMRIGAAGYVTKSSGSEELLAAIRRVAGGRTYLSDGVAQSLTQRGRNPDDEPPPHTQLSRREFRIFEMLVRCQTPTHIARELSLSVKTISTYKARLLRKMGMHHQGELVRYALEHHLLGH